jgi:hypothetical protein
MNKIEGKLEIEKRITNGDSVITFDGNDGSSFNIHISPEELGKTLFGTGGIGTVEITNYSVITELFDYIKLLEETSELELSDDQRKGYYTVLVMIKMKLKSLINIYK